MNTQEQLQYEIAHLGKQCDLTPAQKVALEAMRYQLNGMGDIEVKGDLPELYQAFDIVIKSAKILNHLHAQGYLRTPDTIPVKRDVPEGYALVPIELTAENGMKKALIGEFREEVTRHDPENDEYWQEKITISWTTIKEIHKAMIKAAMADEEKG
jgi:hypothetical protein